MFKLLHIISKYAFYYMFGNCYHRELSGNWIHLSKQKLCPKTINH